MSLLVWLPLHGDLNNYGTSPAKFSAVNNSKALSVGDGGKTGAQMYQRTQINTADYITSDINFTLDGSFSMCCWCKVLEVANTNTANGIITNHGHTTGGFGITLKVVDSSTCYMSCNTGVNSSQRTYMTYYGTTNIFGDWHHLCVTYDRPNTRYKLYVDGVMEKAFNYGDTAGARPFRLFDWSVDHSTNASYRPSCQLNDVRLYDHCLSMKEIQDISKGLILHYPLDNSGFGNTNLLTGGYSVTTTNADGNVVSGSSLKFDTSLMPLNNLIGKTIWFSFDYSVEGDRLNNTGDYTKDRYGFHLALAYKDASGTAKNTYPCASALEKRGTGRAIQSYTIASDITEITSLTVAHQAYNRPADGNTATWSLSNVKLEVGSKATDYTPNPTDMGVNPLRVSEGSGFNRPGTAVQVMESDSDTPRNSASLIWKDNTDFIQIPTFAVAGQTFDEISICGWFKANTMNSTAPNFFNFGANNFVRGRIAGSNSLWSYWNINGTKVGITTSATTPTDDTWHHYAFIFNKGVIKVYYDGVLKSTNDYTGTGTQLLCSQITGWGLGGYSATGEKFIGKQSDFRTYCTALSDAEVLELYEGRPGADKDGNLYGYKLNEYDINEPQITKTCMINTPMSFYENDTANLAYNTELWDYLNVTMKYTPKADTNNSTMAGFKVHYGDGSLNGRRARATVKVTWGGGFDSSSTAGTFAIRFQGGNMNTAGNQVWSASGKSNKLQSAISSAQPLTSLVQSSTTGSAIVTADYTISSTDDYPGDFLGIRADYSNGKGWIELSDIQVSLLDTISTDEQKIKISKDNITANYLYEI